VAVVEWSMSSDVLTLNILLVEDDPVHAHLAGAALNPSPEGCDWRLKHVETLAAACALTETPDLILLDLTLPDARGLETLQRLRERFAFVPVVLLTAVEDPAIEVTARQAGAQDFLGRDELTARTLRRVVRYAMERHRRQADLMRLSTRDELTGLYNRRGFLTAAEPIARLAEQANRTFLVFFADLDGLKAINDAYGHRVGDQALRDAAWILSHSFRSADIVARIGGDEFAVLAPDASPETIEIMIRRVSKWQAERNAEPDRPYQVSLSLGGVAWTSSEPRTLEMMLSEADMAAYTAKRR
jgi:two-component system, cell cycle response regulator